MDTHLVQLLFLDLTLVLLAARALGYLAGRVGQPPVVGEIVAGILLGAMLNSFPAGETLLPTDVRSLLSGLATVGLAWFMFAIGLELDVGALRARRRGVASVAAWSTLIAFVLGVLAALVLLLRRESDHPEGFAVFIGLAMSVTAFPVLARILADRRLLNTRVGDLSLALAALDDVLAWSVLAVLLAVISGQGSWVVALSVPYVMAMVLVVGPALRRLTARQDAGPDPRAHVALFGFGLLSGAATEALGLHFVFGAFLAGAVVNSHIPGPLRADLRDRAEKLSSLLLPVYFVIAGLRIDLAALEASDVLDGLLVLAAAIAGKVGGGYVGARRYGLDRREAGMLATLMNARGLTELVLLEIGYRAGLIDQSLYSVLVVMAVVTTAMTGPVLWLLGRRSPTGASAPADPSTVHRSEQQPEPVAAAVAGPETRE